MSGRELAADALLAVVVGLEAIACVGLVRMRTALARLHYASLGTALPGVLMAIAVAVREGPGLETANACAVALALVGLGPALSHATARAIHRAAAPGEEQR